MYGVVQKEALFLKKKSYGLYYNSRVKGVEQEFHISNSSNSCKSKLLIIPKRQHIVAAILNHNFVSTGGKFAYSVTQSLL